MNPLSDSCSISPVLPKFHGRTTTDDFGDAIAGSSVVLWPFIESDASEENFCKVFIMSYVLSKIFRTTFVADSKLLLDSWSCFQYLRCKILFKWEYVRKKKTGCQFSKQKTVFINFTISYKKKRKKLNLYNSFQTGMSLFDLTFDSNVAKLRRDILYVCVYVPVQYVWTYAVCTKISARPFTFLSSLFKLRARLKPEQVPTVVCLHAMKWGKCWKPSCERYEIL